MCLCKETHRLHFQNRIPQIVLRWLGGLKSQTNGTLKDSMCCFVPNIDEHG